jgi:hypothetical protein
VLVVRVDGGDVQTIDLDAVAIAVGADQLDASFFVRLEGRDVDARRRTRERRKISCDTGSVVNDFKEEKCDTISRQTAVST